MTDNTAHAVVAMQPTRARWRFNYGRIAAILATAAFWVGAWKLWRHVIAPALAAHFGH
jgi:hypothetical protein